MNTSLRQTLRASHVGIAALSLAAATAAVAQTPQAPYRLVIFDYAGADFFYPLALNDLGHLAGSTNGSDGWTHASLMKKDGGLIDLGPGTAFGINNRDQVVGFSVGSDALPMLWGRSGPRLLDDVSGWAYAINDRGEAVGQTRDGLTGGYIAKYWFRGEAKALGYGSAVAIAEDGRMAGVFRHEANGVNYAASWTGTQVTLLGGPGSAALAINDLGAVVGFESDRALLWHEGNAVDLGALAGGASIAFGINNVGDIVGQVGSADMPRAALWRRTPDGYTALDLNDLVRPGAPEAGWVLWQATKINEHGAIVGNARWCQPSGGCWSSGFVMTRSPLPDQYPVPALP